MIYNVTHVTRYTYGATVELTNGIVRLTPVSRDGQTLERFDLVTAPPCLPPTERVDPFGNMVLSLRIEKPHRELSVTAVSRVRVDRPAAPEESPPWETVAEEALAIDSLESGRPASALYPSRRIALFDEATAYARISFTGGRPVHEAALELASRIRSDFVYDPEATEVSTSAPAAFEQRRGVCQDFAHIMIAAIRGLGLPALYVSGYIRTIPQPGKEAWWGRRLARVGVAVVRFRDGLAGLRSDQRLRRRRTHRARARAGLLGRIAHRKHGPVIWLPSARGDRRRRSRMSGGDASHGWRHISGGPLANVV